MDARQRKIYQRFDDTVNMTPGELRAWAKDPRHRLAGNVGNRTGWKSLTRIPDLLEKPRSKWTDQDPKNLKTHEVLRMSDWTFARKVGNFNWRHIKSDKDKLFGREVGRSGYSKRHIGLLNWGHDPGKPDSPIYEDDLAWLDENPGAYQRRKGREDNPTSPFLDALFRVDNDSYRGTDIPRWFFVVSYPEDLIPSLAHDEVTGIAGVADTPEILQEWLWLRPGAIMMPGSAFERLNHVSRVLYDNADYLASNNLYALRRLYNDLSWGLDRTNLFTKMSSYLEAAIKEQATRAKTNEQRLALGDAAYQIRYYGSSVIEREHWPPSRKIQSARGLARWLYTLDWFGRGSTTTIKDLGVSFDNWLASVRRTLLLMGATYADEGEWIVKNKKIQIPKRSVLLLPPDDYEVTWTDPETRKLRKSTIGQLLDDYGLRRRFKIARFDPNRFRQKKERRQARRWEGEGRESRGQRLRKQAMEKIP
jgi:hypothetical protein